MRRVTTITSSVTSTTCAPIAPVGYNGVGTDKVGDVTLHGGTVGVRVQTYPGTAGVF